MDPVIGSRVALSETPDFARRSLSDPQSSNQQQLVNRVLRGWVDSVNLEAQRFVLRSSGDYFEVVCDQPHLLQTLRTLKAEYVVAATCEPLAATSGMDTTAVQCTSLEVLNVAESPPLTPMLRSEVSANISARYRYLAFREPEFKKIFRTRHKLMLAMSDYLDKRDCISVETPILSTPSASGSKEFCVSSIRDPAINYALPQSSQVYGELLVLGGVEAYYQWARCFRDEDLRANRQPEFTQLHLEMAFVDRAQLMEMVEEMLAYACAAVGVNFDQPVPRIAYEDALRWFGSDKPDLRFNVEPELLPHLVTDSPFGRDLNMISTPLPTDVLLNEADVNDLRREASQWKFQLIGFMRADQEGKFIKPQLPCSELTSALSLKAECDLGDVPIWLGRWKFVDNLRRTLYAHLEQNKKVEHKLPKYAWIVDFPLFTTDPDNNARLASQNHPFTAPLDVEQLLQSRKQKDLIKLKSQAFDLVVNGEEIGSGSILIHQYELQRHVLNLLGFSRQTVRQRFGYLLEALRFGAPPMGGFGLGFDRFVAAVCGEDKIRNVIAFPKTKQGYCPVTRGAG